MISTARKSITAMYQPFQFLNNGALSFVSSVIYFLVVRNQPVISINPPNTIPIKIPILILLINIPSTRPRIIAKMNAISPLRTLGCLFVAIKFFLSPLPDPFIKRVSLT